MRSKHALEVLQRELRDTFHVFERLGSAGIDGDPFEEMPGVGPARQPVADTVDGFHLVRDDPRLGVPGVQIVEHENAARAQRSGHVPHDSRVLARFCKVAKAREEVEDTVVRMATERHAHVVLSEPKAPVRAFAGFPDAAGSQVQPGDAEALGRQVG